MGLLWPRGTFLLSPLKYIISLHIDLIYKGCTVLQTQRAPSELRTATIPTTKAKGVTGETCV